jgi:hypothetical protein
MVNLLDSLFTAEKADAFRRLWVDDESSRPALNRELGRAIIAGGDTISVLPCSGENSVNVVMLICASAPFEFDDYEPVMVAGFIMKSMRTPALRGWRKREIRATKILSRSNVPKLGLEGVVGKRIDSTYETWRAIWRTDQAPNGSRAGFRHRRLHSRFPWV